MCDLDCMILILNIIVLVISGAIGKYLGYAIIPSMMVGFTISTILSIQNYYSNN